MKLFTMKEIPINDIQIGARARQDFGDLSSLMESIKDSGLLNPILVTEDLRLIAGERRLRSCKELHLDSIMCRIVPDITEDQEVYIEMIENVARKDFTWVEDIGIKYKLHTLWTNKAKEKGKKWGYRDSSKLLKCSTGTLTGDFQLVEALEHFPHLRELKTKGKAKEEYKTLGKQADALLSMENMPEEEKEKINALMKGEYQVNKVVPKAMHEDVEPIFAKESADGIEPDWQEAEDIPDSVLPEPEHREEEPEKTKEPEAIYACESYETFIQKIPDNSIGLVELDPPYAIDYDKSVPSAKDKDWDKETLFTFYQEYLPVIYNKMLDDSWVLCWTGKEHWPFINEIAMSYGFHTQEPGAWAKPGGSAKSPKTNMVSQWEMFLLFRKGKATFNTPSFPSVVMCDSHNRERMHTWEKPIDLYDKMFKSLSRPGALFLSLFAGSGNALLSALKYHMTPMGCDTKQSHAYTFYGKLAQRNKE